MPIDLTHIGDIDFYCTHFRQRLKERYNIEISESEYFELSKKLIDVMYKLNSNKSFGVLNIKGQDVLVIRNNDMKALQTVYIKDDMRLPVPMGYRTKGITPQQFNIDLKKKLDELKELSKLLLTMDTKTFFMSKPGGHPTWMYSVAYCYWKKRDILRSTIQKLYSNGK